MKTTEDRLKKIMNPALETELAGIERLAAAADTQLADATDWAAFDRRLDEKLNRVWKRNKAKGMLPLWKLIASAAGTAVMAVVIAGITLTAPGRNLTRQAVMTIQGKPAILRMTAQKIATPEESAMLAYLDLTLALNSPDAAERQSALSNTVIRDELLALADQESAL